MVLDTEAQIKAKRPYGTHLAFEIGHGGCAIFTTGLYGKGMSGGPTLNQQGQVVGINSLVMGRDSSAIELYSMGSYALIPELL